MHIALPACEEPLISKGTYYAYFQLFTFILGFPWSSFACSQLKKLLIYLIMALYAAPQFSQAVLAPFSLRSPSQRAHSVLIGQLLEAVSQLTCSHSCSLPEMSTSQIHLFMFELESDLKYLSGQCKQHTEKP